MPEMDKLIKTWFTCATAVLLLAGCKSQKDQLSKLWFYTYNAGSSDPRDTLLTPASFLDLQANGRYTMEFAGFDAGTWVLAGNRLMLTNDKKQVTELSLQYVSGKDLRIYVHNALFEFEGMDNHFDNALENPFSAENNQWRVHAPAKETDKQLTDRLANHFRFWETYFSWALDRSISYVDVRSTPTPIKIYGNGFTLKPFGQLPAVWKAYFYDEEDCRKANDRIEALFDSNSIAWPHTDNKFKMFISAFQQLKQKI